MPLTGEHVPEDYLDALREYWSVGGDVQLSYTTKFLRLADGLVSGKRLSNLPANWQASKSINKSLAEQKEFMLNLCRAAGFETGSPRPGPSHDALMVYRRSSILAGTSPGGFKRNNPNRRRFRRILRNRRRSATICLEENRPVSKCARALFFPAWFGRSPNRGVASKTFSRLKRNRHYIRTPSFQLNIGSSSPLEHVGC